MMAENKYFRIDVFGWCGKSNAQNNKEAEAFGLNPHLWDAQIAVEHENDEKDWLDEVIKLVHIRCPLKVVIAYSHCDQRGKEEILKLSYAAKCMQSINAFKQYNDKYEQFMIILGNCAAKQNSSKTYDSIDYRAYLYNSDTLSFEQLTL